MQFRLHVDCLACGARSYLDYPRAMRRPIWLSIVPSMLALFLADTFFPGIPAAILGLIGFMAFVLLGILLDAGHVSITAVDTGKRSRRLHQVAAGFLVLFMATLGLPIKASLPWIPEGALLGIALLALAASGYCLFSATQLGETGK
ncbi:MAG: hypothetical protein HC888_11825 [Candidatus Competibacteraceae bacterium]|nr:hypothetical protein [Candidatus Competibacteraceae bacterium]